MMGCHQLRRKLMNPSHINDTTILLTAFGEPTGLARQFLFTMGLTAQIGIIVDILAGFGFQHTHYVCV